MLKDEKNVLSFVVWFGLFLFFLLPFAPYDAVTTDRVRFWRQTRTRYHRHRRGGLIRTRRRQRHLSARGSARVRTDVRVSVFSVRLAARVRPTGRYSQNVRRATMNREDEQTSQRLRLRGQGRSSSRPGDTEKTPAKSSKTYTGPYVSRVYGWGKKQR